jgi:chemotaxis family two-component system sensor kinase Cph1
LAPRAVPVLEGLHVSARYQAGGGADVGGDWYDVLDLPGAGVAVVVGDVAGHGVTAATTMGHLQHAVRAYLLDDDSPASLLARLNRLTQWALPGEVASAIVVVVDPDNERARIASAGHLPPLRIAGEAASYVELENGPALGVTADGIYAEVEHVLDDTTMLLFTDGLVERRGESIDVGLSRLAQASTEVSGDALLDHLLKTVPDPGGQDDLAVVALERRNA